MERFEDLIVWQKSKKFVGHIYCLFKTSKDFAFKDQIQRATISIMNNIAEGFERTGKKQMSHFLYIAKGSCGEVRSMLYLAETFSYIQKIDTQKAIEECMELSRIIMGLIKKLN